LTSGYNTFPFFFYYLQDFGILGVTLFPFGLGVASWVIYHRMRTMPTLNAIALYAFCFYAMVISFFTNPLTMLNFAFVVAAVLFVHLLITPKATRFEQSHG
jgi:oligosaccharide repeat unit polymerase